MDSCRLEAEAQQQSARTEEDSVCLMRNTHTLRSAEKVGLLEQPKLVHCREGCRL